jgi:16S rRNA processing protein RimM
LSIEEALIQVGKITRTHGTRGELKVLPGEGSSGAWRDSQEVFLGAERQKASRFRVKGIRGGGKFAILALEGVDSLEAAEALKGQQVFVPRDQLPAMEPGSFYAGDLEGLTVVTAQGQVLGVLAEIFDNGAHEIYVVRDKAREILLPVVDGVVVEVDLDAGRMVVEPPQGLPGLPQSH